MMAVDVGGGVSVYRRWCSAIFNEIIGESFF